METPRRELLVQGEISAASETIVEEIALNCWSNDTRAKDITSLKAAKKTDVIFRAHFEVDPKEGSFGLSR